MISSYLSWRVGCGGLLHPVVEYVDALPRTIEHGDIVEVLFARDQARGVVDLTQSVSGGALAVLVSVAARGGHRQIPISILPGMAISLEEVD